METKPQKHLINLIESTREHHPNFVLFLGAGASVSSGVKPASTMIEEWRRKHFDMYATEGTSFEEHIEKQRWHNKPDEYSTLFELLYDQPTQRREFIETCIGKSSPSWGYIYLVNLIRQDVFNTVFTTNFDDLLNEACYTFSSEVRPIVCAHDSSISSIRITARRPKIIKLHGDFLFDNIKNTMRELETLEQNTQEKFRQYAAEFGFIFIGYAGNDRSVMDTLGTLLRFEQNFPHGIYWCVRKGHSIPDQVATLARFPKVNIVEIEGFDEIFAEAHGKLRLSLQPEMSDPYGALARKLNGLMDQINIPSDQKRHEIIEKDIQSLGRKILQTSPSVDHKISVPIEGQIVHFPIPYSLLADIYSREGNYEKALKLIKQELTVRPSLKTFARAFEFASKVSDESLNELISLYIANESLFSKDPDLVVSTALRLMNLKKYSQAERVLEALFKASVETDIDLNPAYYHLNILQIKRHRNESLLKEEIETLEKILDSGVPQTRMGAAILLEKFDEAEQILHEISERTDVSHMAEWPIMDLLRPHIKDYKNLNFLESK